MNNAEWMIQNGYKFRDIRVGYELDKNITFSLNGAIVGTAPYNETCLAPVIEWLDQEHKEPILNDSEKRYLSAVIKPFRDSVRGIEKAENLPYEMICIDTKYRYMVFPPFDKGTMYKGMKTGWRYTLEELGL